MERTQLIMSKRKFRFNIIDALIILLVLAAVGVIGYVVASEKQAPEEVKQDKKMCIRDSV